jgi:hypothetical protein
VIEQLMNRTFVLDQLGLLTRELESSRTLSEDVRQTTLEALRAAAAREALASSGQPSFDQPAAERRRSRTALLEDVAFLSLDPVISNVQSALEAYFETQRGDLIRQTKTSAGGRRGSAFVPVTDLSLVGSPHRRTDDGRRVFNKFSITDSGWVCSKLAEGITKFRGKHPFIKDAAAPCALPDRARVVIVGDWGTGNNRAKNVAQVMRTVLDEGLSTGVVQHVVHLGDVYYSGWEREYKKRFLPLWPVQPAESQAIGSWALNSNHDMFSGGHAYFETLLADSRFIRQDGSSFFSLESKHWRILALDTAWEAERLGAHQLAWLTEQALDAKRHGQKVMLLSHHPLFSAYKKPSQNLLADVGGILEDGCVDAWLWGHEHRLMSFYPHMNVRFARCIGHGGVPLYMWKGDKDPIPSPAEFEYRARKRHGLEYWAVCGFAVLELDGPTIKIRYLNEFGLEHRSEILA